MTNELKKWIDEQMEGYDPIAENPDILNRDPEELKRLEKMIGKYSPEQDKITDLPDEFSAPHKRDG